MTGITGWTQAFAPLRTITLRDLIQTHPSHWQWLPRNCLNVTIFVLPILIGWYLVLLPVQQTRADLLQEEAQLKLDYLSKLQRTSTLDRLQVEREELRQTIGWHHQQFSDHDDPGLLLGEIAAIATQHQLTLEMAQPAPVIDTSYYQVFPLQLCLLGGYHDIGHFTAALAASPRLFVLAKLQLNSIDEAQDILRLQTSFLSFRRKPVPHDTEIDTKS